MKFRRDRRPTLPTELAWSFYPQFWWEVLSKQWRWGSMYLRLRMIHLSIKRDPKNCEYSDPALALIDGDAIATRELFRNQAAQAYVSQERRIKAAQHGQMVGSVL
jgi:hypothetical protein